MHASIEALVYASTFGAAFAAECARHIRQGRGPAEGEDLKRIAEEADAVALNAVEQFVHGNFAVTLAQVKVEAEGS